MSSRERNLSHALRPYMWLGPAFSLGLFAGRLLSEWFRPGVAGAVIVTLAAIALAIFALRRRPITSTWPLLLLLIYVLYPEPDPRIAASAGLAALLGLLLSTDFSRLSQRLPKPAADLITILLLGLGFLVLYVNTLAPDLLPADAGELQLVAAKLGVAHPTGFPLHTLLANIVTRLPLGPNEAYRANLLSAVTSTATVLLVYQAIYRLCGNRLAGLLGAVALGTSTTFWSQATTANVRSLTALFTAALLYLLLVLRDQQRDQAPSGETRSNPAGAGQRSPSVTWLFFLFVLLLVLAITHHSSLLFIGGLFGLYAIVVQPAIIKQPGRWPILLLGALIALLPLLYLPLRGAAGATGAPDDLTTPGGFLNHVLGLGFRGDLFFFDRLDVLWARLRVMFGVLTFQFSVFMLLIILIGLILLFRRDRLLAIVLALSLGLHTLIAAAYRAPQTVEYMLPVYVLLAVLFGYAAGYFASHTAVVANGGFQKRLQSVAATLLLVAMIMAVVLQATQNYRSYQWLSQDKTARAYAQPLLESAPAGSLLLADWHWATPLWYLQQVEGLRPDVDVQFVYPEVGPYAQTWAGRIAAGLAAGRPVIATHFEPGAYATLPLAEPLGEAFLFRQEPRLELPHDYITIDAQLGPDLPVAGYKLNADTVEAGQELILDLAWRPDNQPLPGQTLFVHLMGQDGYLYAGEDRPARSQDEGLTISQFRLTPRLDTPPGLYDLIAGSYDNGAGNVTTLAQIAVETATTPPFTTNRVFRPLAGETQERTLIGYDWDSTLPGRQRLYLHWSTTSGYESQSRDVDGGHFPMPAWHGPWGIERNGASFELDQPASYVPFGQGLVWLGQANGPGEPASPGQRMALPQAFSASRPIMRDLIVSVRLVGYQEDSQNWAWWDLDDAVPAMGAIPTLKWIAGSRVRDPLWSTISPDAWDGQEIEPLLLLYDAFTSRQLPILDERYSQVAPWVPLGRMTVAP